MDVNLAIAHITAPDGTVFQVLKEVPDPLNPGATMPDWDEAATTAAYQAWLVGHR